VRHRLERIIGLRHRITVSSLGAVHRRTVIRDEAVSDDLAAALLVGGVATAIAAANLLS